jgi:hypothetical protein
MAIRLWPTYKEGNAMSTCDTDAEGGTRNWRGEEHQNQKGRRGANARSSKLGRSHEGVASPEDELAGDWNTLEHYYQMCLQER